MFRRADGSIESSNTPGLNPNYDREFSIYRALIIRAYYADNKDSISFGAPNPETIYDVIILGGKRDGNLLNNVRDCMSLGGQYNYFERTWRASTKTLEETDISKQDGDIVYIGFLNGMPQYPIILGGAAHPQSGEEQFAKEEDAPRMLFQYNGVHVLIDRDGQLFVTRKKGEFNKELGAFKPSEEEPHVKVSFEENIVKLEDDNGNVFIIDAENQKITIQSEKEIEMTSDMIKMIAESEFSVETQVATIKAQSIVLDGATTSTTGTTLLGGGGPGVSRLGDRAVGTGAHGVTVVSTIISGSGTVFSG